VVLIEILHLFGSVSSVIFIFCRRVSFWCVGEEEEEGVGGE
jgi:hypothetical protein